MWNLNFFRRINERTPLLDPAIKSEIDRLVDKTHLKKQRDVIATVVTVGGLTSLMGGYTIYALVRLIGIKHLLSENTADWNANHCDDKADDQHCKDLDIKGNELTNAQLYFGISSFFATILALLPGAIARTKSTAFSDYKQKTISAILDANSLAEFKWFCERSNLSVNDNTTIEEAINLLNTRADRFTHFKRENDDEVTVPINIKHVIDSDAQTAEERKENGLGVSL